MRRYQLATAAAIVVLAVIVMADSSQKAGWTASGPDSSWYPFWSGAVMGVAGALLFVQAWGAPPSAQTIISSRASAVALASLVAPMVVFVALLGQLGLYITSGAYMALFGAAIGRYRWLYVIFLGIGVPAALYLLFEIGFRFSLPKSLFYARGLLPF